MATTLAKAFLNTCLCKFNRNITQVNLNSARVRSNSTYKAAILKDAGKPLVIEEKKRQKLAKNQVRIQVSYCSVNSVDCLSFRDSSKTLPFVPGYELAGEVLEIGSSVTSEQVIQGEKIAALSLEQFGGFAEECVLNVDDIWRLPSNVQVKDAAVLISGHSTALFAFSKLHELKEGQQVLITAGPAGLGLAAVDVAANIYKAKVLGVTDKEEMSELLRERGAFHTLPFSAKLKKHVHGVTAKKGVDVVYDAVGEHMHAVVDSCVANGGRILHAPPFSYTTIPVPPPNSYFSIVSLYALKGQNRELYKSIVQDTLELADQGHIGGHISATYTLSDVNTAIKFIEDKQCTGKVIISND